MRVEVAPTAATGLGANLRAGFAAVAARFEMDWQLHDGDAPTRTLVMVSLGGHCLNDLLFRARSGTLPIVVPAVVSNHESLRPMADFYGVPFHHLPVSADIRQEAEAALATLAKDLDVELIVLARYMQVLSDDLCRTMPGR